jgi:hypothetical protein
VLSAAGPVRHHPCSLPRYITGRVPRKNPTGDVFSGQQNSTNPANPAQRHSRTRTRSGNGIQRLNSLREEHRPAPSPKRPFFKRNHATDNPRLAGELPDTFAKTSPQKRPVMGPRPLSLHGSPIKENKLAPVLPNIYLGETVKIEELEGPNSPRSAPPLLAEFALGKENLDAAVQSRDFDAPESPTPVSRRTAKSTGRRSDLPVLPEIKQEAFFAEQRPDNIQIETDHGPMLSPGLPDSQYLNIFLQANPDGNADLDAFLRAAAFHVAAFRQFGTPLPHIPTSPGVPIVDFQTQQQEVLRDRSTERYQDSVFESTDDSHNDSDDIRAGSYKDKPLPERVEQTKFVELAHRRLTRSLWMRWKRWRHWQRRIRTRRKIRKRHQSSRRKGVLSGGKAMRAVTNRSTVTMRRQGNVARVLSTERSTSVAKRMVRLNVELKSTRCIPD